MRRIALNLRIKGLINIQMAAKDGTVYVLEVNPRASRTIPYVAKATGIPLAKLAAKVMLGYKLRDMGVKEQEPTQRHVAVKEVVLPFMKLRGVDTVLRPEMKSTGEVMGIDNGFDRAFFKAELAAGNPLPLDSNAMIFISVRDEDKEEIVEVVRKLREAGLAIVATEGTATYLRRRGLAVKELKKLHEGSPNVIELMRTGKIKLVINTITDRQSYRDGYLIRRACIDLNVPYITTKEAAKAAASAILGMKKSGCGLEAKSINGYFGIPEE